MIHRGVLASLLAVIVLLVLAACGGDGASPTPTASATGTASPPPGTATPAEPTATPSPQPTATPEPPTATPTLPMGPGAIIEHGSRSSNLVALTFDMGGRVDPALDIMQFLIDNEVRATIFMTGAIVENPNTDAGREVLRIVCDREDLFEPANHSYSHPDFRELTDAEMAEELSTTEAAMLEICPHTPRPRFRPPLGGVDAHVAEVVGENGYPQLIMWDVDTIDWLPEVDDGPTAAEISAKVLANAQGGSIVLMHLGGYNTLDALPAIVSGLRGQGFELARVSELLAAGQ